jgi:hypothetical protein
MTIAASNCQAVGRVETTAGRSDDMRSAWSELPILEEADRKNGCLTSQLRIRDKSCWLRMSF